MPTSPFRRFSLEGRVAVVTGGGRGLGLHAARTLAEAGANVALLGRDKAHLEQAATDISEATGARACFIIVDVSDGAAVDVAAEQTIELFGRVDILINNAGIGSTKSLLEITDSEWTRVLETNLGGACAPRAVSGVP